MKKRRLRNPVLQTLIENMTDDGTIGTTAGINDIQ